jgi:hypothetical protein
MPQAMPAANIAAAAVNMVTMTTQFAAARLTLKAAVFNSDMINPTIFSDWAVSPQANMFQRSFASLLGCLGATEPQLRFYNSYLNSGNVEDIRMTNDPLTQKLFGVCGDNLPHAPIEWISDTLSCSIDGHAILTVSRELKVCAR